MHHATVMQASPSTPSAPRTVIVTRISTEKQVIIVIPGSRWREPTAITTPPRRFFYNKNRLISH
jgi:hypothetical protein